MPLHYVLWGQAGREKTVSPDVPRAGAPKFIPENSQSSTPGRHVFTLKCPQLVWKAGQLCVDLSQTN
jgi:hypothetical protein